MAAQQMRRPDEVSVKPGLSFESKFRQVVGPGPTNAEDLDHRLDAWHGVMFREIPGARLCRIGRRLVMKLLRTLTFPLIFCLAGVHRGVAVAAARPGLATNPQPNLHKN